MSRNDHKSPTISSELPITLSAQRHFYYREFVMMPLLGKCKRDYLFQDYHDYYILMLHVTNRATFAGDRDLRKMPIMMICRHKNDFITYNKPATSHLTMPRMMAVYSRHALALIGLPKKRR